MGETKKMQKRSKWQQTKLEMKKYRMSYVMIAPYFILFFLFTVLPVLASIGISFTDFNMLETPNFVGWRNYIKLLLDDDVFKKAFKNTIIFAVITGPLSYIMCFLFAWIINEFKGKLRAFLTLIFYAPSISGNAFMVWAIIISGDRYGYLNGWLMKWSFLYEPIQWMKTEKYVLPILIIVQLWLSLGTGFLTFIAGLQTVDKVFTRLVRWMASKTAGRNCGTSRFRPCVHSSCLEPSCRSHSRLRWQISPSTLREIRV